MRHEEMLQLCRQYRIATGHTEVVAPVVARWAIEKGRYTPPESDPVARLSAKISRALRTQYVVDPQGRRTRSMLPVSTTDRGRRKTTWYNRRQMTRAQFVLHAQQRRFGILADCRQLKTDVDSFNDNINDGAAVQTVFNFTLDLEEMDEMSA